MLSEELLQIVFLSVWVYDWTKLQLRLDKSRFVLTIKGSNWLVAVKYSVILLFWFTIFIAVSLIVLFICITEFEIFPNNSLAEFWKVLRDSWYASIFWI